MAAIEAVNLTKSHDGRTRALDDLTLSVSEGAVFSLLGPNGSGKTTTVRLLNGMLVPTAGNATVFGLPIGFEVFRIHAMCGVMTETPTPTRTCRPTKTSSSSAGCTISPMSRSRPGPIACSTSFP